MPTASTKVDKPQNAIANGCTNGENNDVTSPGKQVIVILDHKIRNLEKRKVNICFFSYNVTKIVLVNLGLLKRVFMWYYHPMFHTFFLFLFFHRLIASCNCKRKNISLCSHFVIHF